MLQVVRSRILGVDAKRGRLKLNLSGKSAEAEAAAADPLAGLQPGDVVSGAVAAVGEANGSKVFTLQVRD